MIRWFLRSVSVGDLISDPLIKESLEHLTQETIVWLTTKTF